MSSETNKDDEKLPSRIDEIARNIAHMFEERPSRGGAVAGLTTGYARFDELTGGLHRGQLTVILGPRGQLADAFLHNLLWHVASVHHLPAAFFCLDASEEYSTERFLCIEAGADWQALRQGRLAPDEYPRLILACGKLQDVPLFIDDCQGDRFIGEPISRARDTAPRLCLQTIAFDRPGLLYEGADTHDPFHRHVRVAARMKKLARKLNIPVVIGDWLEDNEPSTRFRLAQIAEVILELDCDASTAEQALGRATLQACITRNRNGPTGAFQIDFDPRSFRYLPVNRGE